MRSPVIRFACSLPVWLLVLVPSAQAQQEGPQSIDLPNHMSMHTWFIIGVTGAFLAWSISYTIQRQKEARERRKDRTDLLRQRDSLLDKIADIENRKEAGRISEQRYKHEMKELKFHLRKVVEKIANPETPKSAQKSS
jgi:hypothetical protein